MPRITYRPDGTNKKRPAQERNRWFVMFGDTSVGCISCDIKEGRKIALQMNDKILAGEDTEGCYYDHKSRIWRVNLNRGFDPIEFPHVDDHSITDKPYIYLNGDDLVLTVPFKMTMEEARRWVRSYFKRELLG